MLAADLGDARQFVEDHRATGDIGNAVIEEWITRILHQLDITSFVGPAAPPSILLGSSPIPRTTRGSRTSAVVTINPSMVRQGLRTP
jgi:hypothetical protein